MLQTIILEWKNSSHVKQTHSIFFSFTDTNWTECVVRSRKSYHPVDEPILSWDDAIAYCERLGGHMGTPVNRQESVCGENARGNTPLMFWIGVRTTDGGQTFHDTSGKIITYSNWQDDQPSASASKGCVAAGFGQSAGSGWAVSNCTIRRPFICEREGTALCVCVC